MPAATASLILGRFGKARSCPAGTQLCVQGDEALDICFIRSGIVKLIWTDQDCRDKIIGLRWPGAFVGKSSHITSLPSATTAVTLLDSVVEYIPGDHFLELLKSNQELSMQVHQSQGSEIMEHVRDLAELAMIPARTRLENLLKRLVQSRNIRLPDGRLHLPLTKKELASLLSITPEHLSRLFEQLTADRIISLTGQWIVLHQPPVATKII